LPISASLPPLSPNHHLTDEPNKYTIQSVHLAASEGNGDASYGAKRKWSETIREQPCPSTKSTKIMIQRTRWFRDHEEWRNCKASWAWCAPSSLLCVLWHGVMRCGERDCMSPTWNRASCGMTRKTKLWCLKSDLLMSLGGMIVRWPLEIPLFAWQWLTKSQLPQVRTYYWQSEAIEIAWSRKVSDGWCYRFKGGVGGYLSDKLKILSFQLESSKRRNIRKEPLILKIATKQKCNFARGIWCGVPSTLACF
jgi:hypothetical protein